MAVHVVTDSSCDLPETLARSLDIAIVPCNIHFGQESYRDGVDMRPDEFYRRLAGDVLPKTSQPSVEAFLETYRHFEEPGAQVLSLHLSSKLSTTVKAAQLAKEQMGSQVIRVLDSSQVSLGLGILAMEAARISREGGSLNDAAAFVEKERANIASYFSVDTLEFLVKGGRASKVQGFLGSLLNIKPVLVVKDDGEVHPFERHRNRKRVMERLVELVAHAKGLRALGVLHSVSPEDAEALAEACGAHIPRDKIVVSQFSSVLGTHVGPRALGLVLWTAPQS